MASKVDRFLAQPDVKEKIDAHVAKEPVVPRRPGKRRWLTWLKWGVVITALYFLYGWLLEKALWLLGLHPTVWAAYEAVAAEIAEKSLLGLFYMTSFGALFFLPNPFEAAFSFYVAKTEYYVVMLLVVALTGYLLGMLADYFVGWLVGPRLLRWAMRKKYEALHLKVEKYGGLIVLIGNLIPFFPTGPLSLVMGALRFGWVRLVIWTLLGAAGKLVLIWLGYELFASTVDATNVLAWLGQKF